MSGSGTGRAHIFWSRGAIFSISPRWPLGFGYALFRSLERRTPAYARRAITHEVNVW
jgi:hypothetical protein